MIAEYDIAVNPKAPRGKFICPYCGETVIRRLSKVKNPDLVFCNNDCRAKWQEREKMKKELAMTNDEFLEEVKFCRKIIAYCYKGFLRKFNNVEWDEMKQIALITIWKNHTQANNGKGDKGNFYIEAINKSFFNTLTRRKELYQIEEWYMPVCYQTPEQICIAKGL